MPSMTRRWNAEEHEEDRDDDDGGAGEQQPVVGRVLALGVQGQGHREGVGVLGLRDDERPQEVVPAAEEGEDPQRREGRPAQRQDDPREDLQLARAVDPSRVEQVPGQPEDELPHEEHAERGGQERQEEPGEAVDEPRVRHEDEQRHERHDARDEQGAHDEGEQRLLAAELEHRQGVAEHRAEQEVADGDDDRDDGGVEEVGAEVEAGEQLGVVVEGRRLRQPGRRALGELGRGLEAAEDHPEERCGDGDEGDREDAVEPPRAAAGAVHRALIPSRAARGTGSP